MGNPFMDGIRRPFSSVVAEQEKKAAVSTPFSGLSNSFLYKLFNVVTAMKVENTEDEKTKYEFLNQITSELIAREKESREKDSIPPAIAADIHEPFFR